MSTILLIILLVLALTGGAFGYSRVGFIGFSPLGLVLLVVLILYLTGNLHMR